MDGDRRGFLRHAACAAAALALPASVRAVAFASRAIRIVVGFPAGGPLDIVARTIAPPLAGHLGATVDVDNVIGAGGSRAAIDVARAAPDGHTLLLCGPVNVIDDILLGTGRDFARDIVPVALIASVPLVVEVNPAVPVRSIPALLAYARARPGGLRIAYAGVGTPQHIAIEQFRAMTGAPMALAAHAGSAPALEALLRGDADAMFDPLPSSLPHLRAGRLVALATTGTTRAPLLPDVPALHEVVPGYAAGSWFGLGAPRHTPNSVVATLNAAVNAGLADPATRERLRALGATARPGSAAQFGRFLRAETIAYRRVIRATGIVAASPRAGDPPVVR